MNRRSIRHAGPQDPDFDSNGADGEKNPFSVSFGLDWRAAQFGECFLRVMPEWALAVAEYWRRPGKQSKGQKMSVWKKGFSLMALLAMTTEGHAADLCDPAASAALKTAAIQQELMVAGFTCGAEGQYNRFVNGHRQELRKSDAILMTYFKTRDHGREAGYDSYKTRAANLSANRSASDGALYCQAIAQDFDAAEHHSLKDFIAQARLVIPAPDACAVKYGETELASVDLPAPPPSRRNPHAHLRRIRTAKQ